jgi:mersacidin/lichenicidin family type 2 lantibiotic
MTREEIIRAWRDEDYRLGLSAEQQALAAHPAGPIEVLEDLLDVVAGGQGAHSGAARSFLGRGVRRFPMGGTITVQCQTV